MAKILIIDDDQQMNEALAAVVLDLGHSVFNAFSIKEGFSILNSEEVDVVFLDVRLPDGSGLKVLPKIRNLHNPPEVIIITAYENENGAELAINKGAWNYIKKPATLNDLKLSLVRALQYREEKSSKPFLLKRDKITGKSKKINDALEKIVHVAQTETSVLITGETGTGKELFAQAIHGNSNFSDGNFVIVDCGSLPESLAESILFGHEKGAFTSAYTTQDGLIAQANGGTLFLDEIGELPLTIQKSFLRVLQERRFVPIGSQKEKHSKFRLIAATHRNLEDMVKTDTFRRDLYFRINSFTIELPSLRERTEDIRLLFYQFMEDYCKKHGVHIKGYTPEFLQAINTYDWPGNVRELKNTVDQIMASSRNQHSLFQVHLPNRIRIKISKNEEREHINQNTSEVIINNELSYKEFCLDMERQYFINLLSNSDGDKNKAILSSGLSKSQFYALLKKHKN
jgi:two-component system, NtrC family, response regulator